MSASLFFVLIFLILAGFYYNHVIQSYINRFELLKNITKAHINQLLTIILVIIVLIAGLTPNATKQKYSSISNNFDNIRTPEAQRRPNPMFDIDTYW
jgi:branched-subunit amino acid permease